VKQVKGAQLGAFYSYIVAGAGFAPTPTGYAYHSSFRWSTQKCFMWSGLCLLPFLRWGSSPSSLYTFPDIISGLGSALSFFVKREDFTEFDEYSPHDFSWDGPYSSLSRYYSSNPLYITHEPLYALFMFIQTKL